MWSLHVSLHISSYNFGCSELTLDFGLSFTALLRCTVFLSNLSKKSAFGSATFTLPPYGTCSLCQFVHTDTTIQWIISTSSGLQVDLKKVQLSITAYTHPKAAVVFALLTNYWHNGCVHMKCENGLDLLRVSPITVLLQVILEGKENNHP